MLARFAWFRRQSIERKLSSGVAVTSVAALVAACTVFSIYDYVSSRARVVRDVATLADVIGTNSTAALTFRDPAAATTTLRATVANEHITDAHLFMRDGTLLASYRREDLSYDEAPVHPVRPDDAGVAVFEGDRLRVVRPILHDGERIGLISVESDLLEIWSRWWRFAGIAAGTLAGAFVIVFLLSRGIARQLFEPIARLVAVTHVVRRGGRYDVRAAPGPDDEIGELIVQFNAMLSDVQRRDQQLLQQQAGLEQIVNTRTAELRASNEALATARDRALDASRAKSEFLANMSHEIRTPMNGIIGMIEIALNRDLPPEQYDELTTVQSSAHQLLSILNDILDFSKIEARQLNLEHITFSLRQAIEVVLEPLAVRARQQGLQLTIDVAEDVPQAVIGDPTRVQQVVTNLVANAIKFTERGAVRVTLQQDASAGGVSTLHLAVADTGVGIPAEQHAAIFEAFRQADGSTTRRFGGTGLGLTISADLVHLMGGRIWLESTPGAGSTFHCTFVLSISDEPLAASPAGLAANEAHAGARSPVSPSRISKTARPYRVLLVEDNAVNQQVACGLLNRRGHVVVVAPTGREALAWLDREPFDAVLMDLQMPIMGGLEATAAIRERERTTGAHVRIIAMTAHAAASDRVKCLSAGMDDYLPKPLDSAALLAAVEGHGAPAVTAVRETAFFDEAAVRSRLSGDESLMSEVIRIFLEQLPSQLQAIDSAVQRRNSEELCIAAHSLKGAAANLSATALLETARVLERAGADARFDDAEAAWQRLTSDADALASQLRTRAQEVQPCEF